MRIWSSSGWPRPIALKPEMGLSPEIEAVMVRAMQKQPIDRFASATEFDRALADVPELQPRRPSGPLPQQARPPTAPAEQPPPAPTAEPTTPPTEPKQRQRKISLVVVVVLTTLITLGLLLLLLVRTGVVEPW